MLVEYSPEAIKDLHRLVDFIEPKNPYAARRLAIDIQEDVSRLKLFPKMGLPVMKAPDPELMRDLYVSSYTVRYLIADTTLYILRIWHGKENEKSACFD